MDIGMISVPSSQSISQLQSVVEFIKAVSSAESLAATLEKVGARVAAAEAKEAEVSLRSGELAAIEAGVQKALASAEEKESQADAALVAASEYEKAWEARVKELEIREEAAANNDAAIEKKIADFNAFVEKKKEEFSEHEAILATHYEEVEKQKAFYEEKLAALKKLAG